MSCSGVKNASRVHALSFLQFLQITVCERGVMNGLVLASSLSVDNNDNVNEESKSLRDEETGIRGTGSTDPQEMLIF